MQQSKFKKVGLLLSLVSLMTLTSCSEDETNKNYPADQIDKIVTIDDVDVYYNTKEEYYGNITDAMSNVLNKLLVTVAKEKVGDGENMPGYTALTKDEIQEKMEEVMIKKADTGSYSTNYYFDEEKFVMDLKKNMHNIDTTSANSTCDFSHKVVINSNTKYDEIFTCDYQDYMEKEIKDDILINQLITEYLYADSYTSIGTTAARDVSFVKLVDGKNSKVGSALKFINAYLDDLRAYGEATTDEEREALSYTQDLNILSEAYKGHSENPEVEKFFAKHESLNLQSLTLLANIDDELKKIATYDEESHSYIPLPDEKIDSSLFSDYTGSMSYSIDVGVQKKKLAITQQDNFITGMFLSSTGISDLPDAIKTRVFSSNYNTSEDSTKKDVTVKIGGKRFLTTTEAQNEGDNRQVIFYDSSSTAYYLVQINEVVTTGVLAKNSDDDEATLKRKKELVKKVSYKMIDSSSYRKDSVVYFLKDAKLEFHNEDFYDYMIDAYPALFDESTYEED